MRPEKRLNYLYQGNKNYDIPSIGLNGLTKGLDLLKKSQQKNRGSQVFICIFPRPQLNFLFSPTLLFLPPSTSFDLPVCPQDHESLFFFMAAFSMSSSFWMFSLIPIVFVGWRVSKQSRPQHGESTRVYIFSSPQSSSSSLPISSPHVFSPSHPLTCLHPNTHMASFSRIQHGLLSLELDPDSRL